MSFHDAQGNASPAPGAHNISHLRVADVIGDRSEIYSLRPEDTVEAAAQKLKNWRVRTAAVTDDVGNVAGILGQSDISSRVVAAGIDPRAVAVRDVMTGEPICIDIETDLLTCVRVMRQHGISHIVLTRPTPEGEQYFGMVSANDVLGVLAHADSQDTSRVMHELAGGTNA
jgi:predicted transcriptional regulator